MKWIASHSRFTCPECQFEVYVPIVETNDVAYGLYDDARFPGRGMLVFKEHFQHLDEMPEDSVHSFIDQAISVGRVLRHLGLGPRINYAVLGNEHPHVHWHIIPRQGSTDSIPTRPVWEHPEKAHKLGQVERRRLVEKIQKALLDS